ncbi:hypothetical protein D9M69_661060 [compost metagenome]
MLEPNASQLEGQMLKTTGAATGVAIGIYDKNNNLVDLKSSKGITENLVPSGAAPDTTYSADIGLRAAYVRIGADQPTAGPANASLPFTLIYD